MGQTYSKDEVDNKFNDFMKKEYEYKLYSDNKYVYKKAFDNFRFDISENYYQSNESDLKYAPIASLDDLKENLYNNYNPSNISDLKYAHLSNTYSKKDSDSRYVLKEPNGQITAPPKPPRIPSTLENALENARKKLVIDDVIEE
jgi:hypothetical protein